MRTYELVLILKPQMSDSDIAEFIDRTKKLIASEGGQIVSEDKWGRRKFAHPMGHTKDGFYSYIKFQSPPQSLAKLNQHFRVQESVLRTLIVKSAKEKAKKASAAGAKK